MERQRTGFPRRFGAAAIAAAAGLAACATIPHEPPFVPPFMLVGGSEAGLARFEAAARACGADVRSIPLTHSRWVGIRIDPAAPPGDPRIDCALRWIADHPEEELGFVGNEARE